MLTFTERAREMVRTFMDQNDEDLQALRITLGNGSPLAPAFELTLVDEGQDRSPDDVAVDAGGFTVLVHRDGADRLEGATVDFVERLNESGFEIRPAPGRSLSAPPPEEVPGGGGDDSEVGRKVKAILDHQVNPAVAAHGGRIDLVGVRGTEVYMEMAGGCQGCAMSRLTLRQGVERMIRQAVPEVTAIHDVTDHDAGENPYFTSPA